MGLLPTKEQQSSEIRVYGIALATGLPFVCYLLTASAHGYWLDAGEFVAASVELGISHPPGQPLTALIGRLFAMLPFGPLSLRVALASAAMASCACAALFCAIETTVRCMGVNRPWVVIPTALGTTWIIAGSYGWWFQAVRPEVYALQAALTCLILERVTALEAAWPTLDVRPIITAAFVMGLALANHHFLAVLILPAMMPMTGRILRSRGWRPLLFASIAGMLGLATYIYLPLRAANNPLPNLGDPSSLSRFFWVVSAQAFQKNTGSGVPQPLTERFLDVGVQLVENLHILCPLAIAGVYAILRTPGARRLGLVWLLTLIFNLVARAWLGFIRSNPDALGYLLPSFAAIGVFFAALVGALVTPKGGLDTRSPTRTAVIVALVIVALGLAQIHKSSTKASLARFTVTDDFDALLRRQLPPRSIVLSHAPQTLFLLWGTEVEDHLRPDITLVPIPFLHYPLLANNLVRNNPAIQDLVLGYLLYGELLLPELQTLATQQPLYMEMDIRVSPLLYKSMVPAWLYYEVLAGGATVMDERIAADTQHKLYEQLYRRIQGQLDDPATRSRLIWHHYFDALYYMSHGDRKSAAIAVDMARNIEPMTKPLAAMQAALADEEQKGPLNITPFLESAFGMPNEKQTGER